MLIKKKSEQQMPLGEADTTKAGQVLSLDLGAYTLEMFNLCKFIKQFA